MNSHANSSACLVSRKVAEIKSDRRKPVLLDARGKKDVETRALRGARFQADGAVMVVHNFGNDREAQPDAIFF